MEIDGGFSTKVYLKCAPTCTPTPTLSRTYTLETTQWTRVSGRQSHASLVQKCQRVDKSKARSALNFWHSISRHLVPSRHLLASSNHHLPSLIPDHQQLRKLLEPKEN